jgi:hypothetical protein
LGEACSSEAAEAAATPGRSEPRLAYRTSRFRFFKTADLPPEQDFLQVQETGRAFCSGKVFDCLKPVRLQCAIDPRAAQDRRKLGVTATLSHVLHRTIPIIVELKEAFPAPQFQKTA